MRVTVDRDLSSDLEAPPRVALAHDWLVGMRGGERVLERFASLFGPTDLYVMVSDGQRHAPAIEACRLRASAMQGWPGARTGLRRWYLPLYPLAVRSLHIRGEFDLLLSSSSAMIKSIRPPMRREGAGAIPHVCYCHSPPRYLWTQRDEYAVGGGGALRRAGIAMCGERLRRLDRASARSISTFIANSSSTQRAIAEVYERDAIVIHPPVDTEFFSSDASVTREGFYLVVSALEPYKRVDLAIEAARQGSRRLVIVGRGSQEQFLRGLAGPGVEFRGWLDRTEIRNLYRRAAAMLFPGVEDFGIAPVEAMACGCPVIARRAGGALDWMTDEVGVTFDEPTPGALLDAIERFESAGGTPTTSACRLNAERFATERFDRAIVEVVEREFAGQS